MTTALLQTYDTRDGSVDTVLQVDRLIEAPNWMPDGTALLVNCAGRLYRVSLAEPALQQIDTGSCDRLNNDHGPSPDGRLIAFCDKVETGKSCIYVMPAGGGAVRRVTDHVPSWFHSWSPDGQQVVYAAVRAGQFAIASCPVAGGAEKVLITSPHHYDGPDVTPDGAWIWFNSDRDGGMTLYRMRRDGSDLQQMTAGDRVDWFPHPSPDGRQVVYLSYPPGTEGHPFGLDVELRLMPADGGRSEVAVRLYGGQGTLNGPCWSPDGRRFAFVRYLP